MWDDRKCKGICVGMPILVKHTLEDSNYICYWHIVAAVNTAGTRVKTYGYYHGKKLWEKPFYWDMEDVYMRIIPDCYEWRLEDKIPPIVYYLN